MDNTLNLQSPWLTYVGKMVALFANDDDVKVEFDQESMNLKLYVDCATKADALTKLLKDQISFGNVSLTITVIPGDDEKIATTISSAFAGNPRFSKVATADLFGTGNLTTFAIFKPEVIQFFNDDLTDYYGNWNGLAEDIAREVFKEIPNVNYSTDIRKD